MTERESELGLTGEEGLSDCLHLYKYDVVSLNMPTHDWIAMRVL